MGIIDRLDRYRKSSSPSAGSRCYEAPEALNGETPGRRQDIWSLLCCNIEILAFMKCIDRATFCRSMRLGYSSYYSSQSLIVDWLGSLKPAAADQNELMFIQLLVGSFKTNPEERLYARGLAEQIQAIGEQRLHKHIGKCCVVDDTVNDSSILNASQYTLSKPEDLEKGSLLHFLASTARSLDENAILTADSSLASLYQQVSNWQIRSIHSAEQDFLLLIAPEHTEDGKAYLSLYNRFVKSVTNAVGSGTYVPCLCDISLGEHNNPYTTELRSGLSEDLNNFWANKSPPTLTRLTRVLKFSDT